MAYENSIPLREVPQKFFPDLWESYCECWSSEESAITNLNHPSALWVASMAELEILRGEPYEGTANNAAQGRLGKQIVDAMKRDLRSRQLVATALQPPGLPRVEIPATLWADLEPNFAENSAESANYKFILIEVRRPADDPSDRTAVCVAWLKGQPRQVKKILLPSALSHIPGLQTREFDAAYMEVFGTSVGRPLKNPQK